MPKQQQFSPIGKVIKEYVDKQWGKIVDFHKSPPKEKLTMTFHLVILILLITILNQSPLDKILFKSLSSNATGWVQSNLVYGLIANEIRRGIVSKIDLGSSIMTSVILFVIILYIYPLSVLFATIKNMWKDKFTNHK